MISYCKLKILPKNKSEVPNIGNFDRWYFLMISYCKLKVLVREYFLMISFENTRIKENPFFGLLPNPPQNNGWVDFPWHYMTGSPLLWIFLDEPGGLTLPPLHAVWLRCCEMMSSRIWGSRCTDFWTVCFVCLSEKTLCPDPPAPPRPTAITDVIIYRSILKNNHRYFRRNPFIFLPWKNSKSGMF